MTTPLFASSLAPAAAPALDATSPGICPSDVPLVLLPVRLETRFFTLPSSVVELRIRVYPDAIHMDSHEPDLLPGEREWGVHYWEQDWRAGSDGTARAAAWAQLADRFGPERAAWIARSLTPTNAPQRPSTPVPAPQKLTVAPVFPAVTVVSDGKDSAWRRAPQAQLLPDRWTATLHSFAQPLLQVTGQPIARPLAVGPNPQAPAPPATTDGLSVLVDDGMKWMVDFDAAEAAGMALRMTIPPAVMSTGIAFLFVFGVATSLGPVPSAARLASLLDAHHYTHGLEFLRYGTPTNNTEDARSGGYADDTAHAKSYAAEVAFDPATLDPTSNAARLAQAFGMTADRVAPVLGRVGGAGQRHERDQRSMNAALWQPGWGYYLSNMIGFQGTTQTPDGFIGNGMSPDTVAWARDHFVKHVRSFGPYPILRCGRQPYGVLPVTSLDLWAPRASEQAAMARDVKLKALLIKLRDNIWYARLGEALRLGRRWSPVDPDADLADVMRTDGISQSYGVRSVFGRHYFQYLRAFLGEDVVANGFMATHESFMGRLLMQLGIQWASRTLRSVPADQAWPISSPLIQTGEISRWTTLQPNYVAALLAERNIDALVAARPDPNVPAGPATSLFSTLLRHAMLRELAHATALVAAGAPGADLNALMRDSELIDLVTGAAPTLTWKRQLDLPAPGDPGNRTIRQLLQGLTAFDAPAVATLGDFRASLAYLQGLDTESLQYLLQGTLDLSAHRLDAWITSFATKRLSSMSAAGPRGAYVGGYGWVENLRLSAPAQPVPAAQVPAGETGALVFPAGDSGFVHAPSTTHAAAAALLRNAHLGPTGVPAPDGPFAIDLSSRRVREAEQLLDGVRQGQPLTALLGYRVERGLHDLGLDRFIAPLRRLAPLARTLVDGGAVAESIAANNVVDGLELNRRWQQDRASVNAQLQGATAPERTSIGGVLDALAAAIDGLSDALTAEAAYQIARGNTSRIASTLAAISQGDAPPPELEVAHVPRSGTALTHRLLVLLNPAAVPAAGWPAATTSPLASAEPALNAWASSLLGDCRKARCTIARLDDGTGAVVETRAFPLSELRLSPLDLVYGVDTSTSASPTAIEQRVLYHAKHRAGGFAPAARLRLQHDRPATLAAGELTLFDVLEQARAVQRLLGSARGVDPEDVNPPERAAQGAIDLVELEGRVVRAENGLSAAHAQLAALAAKPATSTAESMRTALLALGGYGVGPAVPVAATGDDAATRAALAAQAAGLLKTSGPRVDSVARLRAVPAATDARARCQQLVDRMTSALGAAFVVLPRFSCGVPAAAELTSALAGSTQAMGGDALAANTWLMRSARVRETAARLGAALRGAEVLGTGDRLSLTVAQLPYVKDERWVGLPAEAGKVLPPSKLSLVLHMPVKLDLARPLAGLWVDEWLEVVPSRAETTAVAFQFNPPDACAPQNVLIAVPPVPDEDWTVQKLDRVLMETLQLAKIRTVDPEILGQLAQHLPALYFAFNAKDDVVSTDFAPLTR